jgi:hypothetical protein
MRITLEVGDITAHRADAVVNAANSSLLGGGGVDGAIHRRGGPAILAACREVRASHYPDGLPAGQAVATTAGELPARWVIHTVGPVYSASEDRSAVLASCYAESLRVADELGAKTVAFPGGLGRNLRMAARGRRADRAGHGERGIVPGRGGPVRPVHSRHARGFQRRARLAGTRLARGWPGAWSDPPGTPGPARWQTGTSRRGRVSWIHAPCPGGQVTAPSPRFRSVLDQFAPYRPGQAVAGPDGRSFKLSSNESPFGPLPSVVQAIAEACADVNRYPDNGAVALTEAIARRYGVPPGHIALGCGSVGVTQQLLEAAAEPGGEVLYAWRSFEAYPLLVKLAGADEVRVPIRDETHDLAAMAAAITPRTRVIFVCNPNNPTGTVVHRAELEDFLDRVPPGLPGGAGRGLRRVCARPGHAQRPGTLPRPPEHGRPAYLLQGLRAGRAAGRLPRRP